MRSHSFCSCFVALIFLAPIFAPGQSTIRVTTRLVEVNVIVRDKNGPLDGLTKDDFTLFDSGKKREIAFFSKNAARGGTRAAPLVTSGAPEPSGNFTNRPAAAAWAQPNVTVVLLDGINTEIRDQLFAKKQCIQFLQQIRPEDRIAVYALGVTLRVIQDFTGDSQRLVKTLARYQGDATGHLDATNPAIANTGDEELDRWLNDANAAVADHYLKDRVERTVAAMEAIANHVGRVPGRKNLIWLSGSFPFTIGLERDMDPLANIKERGSFGDQIRRATRALSNANIAVYPVDARGLIGVAPPVDKMQYVAMSAKQATGTRTRRGNPAQQAGQQESDVAPGQETMRILAQETGGKALYGTNDVRAAIRLAVDDAELTYTLAFYPDAAKLDAKFHPIKVEVKRKGLDLRHRTGYLAEPEAAVDDASRMAQIADAIWSPLDGNGIALTARLEPADPLTPGTVRFTVTVNALDVSFRLHNDRWTDTIDMVFTGKTVDGREIGTLSEIADLTLEPETYQQVKQEGLSFTKTIEVNRETARIRVLIVDRNSGRLGSLTIPIRDGKQ
jgi:VWFA-related protein